MSDTPTGSNDLVRKRSRSTSPGTADSPAAAKKANLETAAPSNLSTVSDSTAAPIQAESGNGDATAAAADGAPSASVAAADDSGSVAPAVDADTTMADSTSSSAPAPAAAAPAAADPAAAATIIMRALIVTQDASIIIGKAGKNVNEIREKSGSKVTITEAVPNTPERVMTISGALDAVSKAFGLVVRRINDEPFDTASVPGSRAVTIRFIIPNSRMGSVIGKGGSKIKEIQEASGARLQASEAMLPGSTERVLSVSGVADAIHIAVYYIGTILQEAQANAPRDSSYRPFGGEGGGGGRDDRRDDRGPPRGDRRDGPSGGGGVPRADPNAQMQQIYIPNELVGSIIGKAGAKINEIRQLSQCQIKINEPGESSPGANPAERLVTITGPANGIQVAVRLLYQRLEQERDKKAATA